MAKWDERDPRWLVEHREDGKNVNGWHWEEKNKLEWSKQHISTLLTSLPPADAGSLRITKIREVIGEASVSTRKGNKKLAIYDLRITAEWQAQSEEDEEPVKGTIKIEEFTSHSEPDEYVYTVTADGTAAARDMYKAVAESLRESVFQQLQQFVQDLAQQ